MKSFDRDYFKEESKISKDFIVIVAKYMDYTHSTKFALIDYQYSSIFRRLPDIKRNDRPWKPRWLIDTLSQDKHEDFEEKELIEDVQDDPSVVDQRTQMRL